MKQFIEKTILVQEADVPNAPVYRMLVLALVDPDTSTYQIADLGVVERAGTPTAPQELRDWMNRSGFTQKALAEALGVHQATVSYWLSGKRGVPAKVRKMMSMTAAGLGGDKGALVIGLQEVEGELQRALERVRALQGEEEGTT